MLSLSAVTDAIKNLEVGLRGRPTESNREKLALIWRETLRGLEDPDVTMGATAYLAHADTSRWPTPREFRRFAEQARSERQRARVFRETCTVCRGDGFVLWDTYRGIKGIPAVRTCDCQAGVMKREYLDREEKNHPAALTPIDRIELRRKASFTPPSPVVSDPKTIDLTFQTIVLHLRDVFWETYQKQLLMAMDVGAITDGERRSRLKRMRDWAKICARAKAEKRTDDLNGERNRLFR